MVRGDSAGGKRNLRKRLKFGEEGSDDSDEDYVISEEETDVSEVVLEDLDGSALDEDEVEDEYEVEEEEEVEEEGYNSRKLTSRPISSHGNKANNKSLPKNGAVYTKYDEDEVEDEEVENEEEGKPNKSGSSLRSSCGKKSEVGVENEEDDEDGKKEEEGDPCKPHSSPRSSRDKKSDRKSLQKNRAVPFKEEDDEEYIVNDEDEEDDNDEDDDDEFTHVGEDDNDCLEDEEDLAEKKRTGSEITTYRITSTSKASQRSGRRNKKSKISRKASKKRGTERVVLRRKSRSDNDGAGDDTGDFLKDSTGWRRLGIKNTRRRKRRYVASSDSDFATSGSSDCEYTISEEEREQVTEANDFCGTLAPCTRKTSTSKRSVSRRKLSARSTSSCNRTGEGDNEANQSKPTGAKGKEKMEESNVVKQVCGICLSEEDKRKVRGTLDCCSHYFCFTCIREWSKVESRCPLCKQRFHTITKPARCTAGLGIRDDVIHVPERDQVYQPTDEEIIGYLDPYESVICTECLQGGDDDLMLLCDICDSPAHTFCVGLGREVPEGSWYCYGCRPSALASLSSLSQDNQRMSSNLSSWTMPATECFDLNAPPSIQVLNLQSLRYPPGISQSFVPLSGAQEFTLSGRRMMHRHIQLRNGRSPGGGRTDGSATSIFQIESLPYPVDQGRLAAFQPTGMEARAPYVCSFGGLQMESSFPASQRREIPVFAASSTSGRFFSNGYAGVNLISVPDQSHKSSSRLSVSSDGGGAPPSMRERSYFCQPEEQLQAMIRMHLRSMSAGNALGYGDFKDVERSSIQNILAVCGIGHWNSEVAAIPPPSVCSHVDIMGNGQRSLMKGACSACFDVFVREVVQNNLNLKRQQQWLSLGLYKF